MSAANSERLTGSDLDATGAVWAAVASSPHVAGLSPEAVTELANGAEHAARVAAMLVRENALTEGAAKGDPKAVNAELLLLLKEAIAYIEHEKANVGKATTDAEWDANVAALRASPVSEYSIGRSAVPKARLRIRAARALIERIEGSL